MNKIFFYVNVMYLITAIKYIKNEYRPKSTNKRYINNETPLRDL